MKVKKKIEYEFEFEGCPGEIILLTGEEGGDWKLINKAIDHEFWLEKKAAKDLYKALHEVFGKKEKEVVTTTPVVVNNAPAKEPPRPVPPEFAAIDAEAARHMSL